MMKYICMNYKTILSLIILATMLMSMESSSDNFDFPKAWKEVEKLANDNLPKSVIAKVNEIAEAAMDEDNRPQQVKATSYVASYKLRTEEDGLDQAIVYLSEQIKESKSDEVKAINRVMLADFYKQYLRNNGYRIAERTDGEDNVSEDYKMWSKTTWIAQIADQYGLAIKNSRTLDIPIVEYQDILANNGGSKADYNDIGSDHIPSLYILFAEKAIQSYKEIGNYGYKGIGDFVISDATYFSDETAFNKLTIGNGSLKEHILSTYQKLLKYTKGKSQDAHIRQDHNRLQSVNEFSKYSDSKKDYIIALRKLANENKSSAYSATVMNSLALVQQAPYTKDGNLIAMEICKEAIAAHPKSRGAVDCENLIIRLNKAEINITSEEVYLPNDPILYRIDYKNISKLYSKIVKIETDKMEDMHQRDRNAVKKIIESKNPLKSWSTDLPSNGLYTMQSTEAFQEGLPLGSYVLVMSDKENFSNAYYHAIFHVSRISYTQVLDQEDALKFIIKDRGNSKVLSNATIYIYKDVYNYNSRQSIRELLTTVKADGNGLATYNSQDRNQIAVVVKNGDDILDLRKYHNGGRSYHGNVHHSIEFFTDRSIYRPGQVVYFKGVVMQKDANQIPSVAASHPVTVVLRDANYQDIETLSLKSNEFGSVNGQFTLPSGGLNGSFTLDAGFGQTRVQVEEYKRPTFEVEIDTLKTAYALGQTVDLSGVVKTFAGSSIADGEVSYTVSRKTIYPYWRYYSRYGSPNSQQALISQGTTVSDAEGVFTFPVELDGGSDLDPKRKPSFHFEVKVDVTDISGETRSGSYTLYAGVAPYILSLDVSDAIDQADLKSITLDAKNHSQQDVQSIGTVEIYRLQSPKRYYRNRYWNEVDTTIITTSDYESVLAKYGDPKILDASQWKVDQKVQEYKFNINGKGNIELEDKLSAGTYKILIKDGSDIEIEKIITVTDFDGKKFPHTKRLYYKLDQKRYQPGNTVTINFGSPDKTMVMYSIESFGKKSSIKHFTANSSEELKFLVRETDRGNIKVHLQYIHENRVVNETIDVPVDWSNKNLKIRYETIRDNMLPGTDQEWKMIVSGIGKDQLAAEVLVSMYDSSLDMFKPHDWKASWYPNYTRRVNFTNFDFNSINLRNSNYQWNRVSNVTRPQIRYPRLMEFLRMQNYGRRMKKRSSFNDNAVMMESQPAPAKSEGKDSNEEFETSVVYDFDTYEEKIVVRKNPNYVEEEKELKTPAIRKNLNETVFFFPKLKTDKDGSLVFSFKMNEALTSWKLQTFAHTKDLQYGLDSREVKTSQPLMIFPNKPRFLRQGDEIELTAKVANLSKENQAGQAEIKFFDALTMEEVTDQFLDGNSTSSFNMEAGASDVISWKCNVPSDLQTAIMYRITAISEDHTDGEENTVALLSNRQLVTETIPMHIKGGQSKTFTMKSLSDKSKTADPFKYTVELTSHPVWYAVQALPYMMEYPHECTEQIVNRYYSNSLASTVANAHPRLRNVFDRWKGTDSDALLSNLSKNQELKSALLEETPWVRAGQSEETQKRNIGLLFDLNRMSNEMTQTWRMLEQRQLGNGGFPWFPGGRDSWYITQYLLEDLGHLRQLGIEDFSDDGLITNALRYIDTELLRQYELTKDDKHGAYLTHMVIHYMYVRSFFPNVAKSDKVKEALDFYHGQARSHWNKKGIYQQGMMGLAFHRDGIEKETVAKIKASLKERALTNDELGTYWRTDNGFYWHQLPIETHALLMEFFALVDNDKDFAENTKIWLLKQKQTTNWKTTKATSAAIYALLLNKNQKISDWVIESDMVEMKVGGKAVVIDKGSVEAGTGYYKKSWNDDQINSKMGTIELNNPNESVAWGAAYYQYWEQLDEIKSYDDNPLTIARDIYKIEMTDQGEKAVTINEKDVVNTGDKIRVRLKVVVDRPMEYVHLKDMRASGMEPIDVISTYKWQDGLGYYQSTKDLATHFFISYLPVGTYVLEYDMRASIPGLFSTGIANIQSMYAPEFGAHSEGRVVEIKR